MTIVAIDPSQTRSVVSMPVRYQVARAAFTGALAAVGVAALSAAALALFFGLVPTNPVAVSSQLPDEAGIIAEPPALAGSRLTTLSQPDRDAKPVVVEPTSERAAPVQETTATQASPVPPPEPLAGAVSSSANLLSTTPFGLQPVTFVPAASVQTRNTSAEHAQPETAATRTVVNKPQAAVADKKTANPVAERVGAVASIKKATLIRPVRSTPVTQPRGTEATQARSGPRAQPTASREAQRDKVPRKPMVAKAANAVSVAEASASPGQAAPAPAETEQLEAAEVFGLKVPSLAPAGRKIRESVEALGGAVKSLADRF